MENTAQQIDYKSIGLGKYAIITFEDEIDAALAHFQLAKKKIRVSGKSCNSLSFKWTNKLNHDRINKILAYLKRDFDCQINFSNRDILPQYFNN